MTTLSADRAIEYMKKFFKKLMKMPLTVILIVSCGVFVLFLIPGIGKTSDASGENLLTEPLIQIGLISLHDGENPFGFGIGETASAGGGSALSSTDTSGSETAELSSKSGSSGDGETKENGAADQSTAQGDTAADGSSDAASDGETASSAETSSSAETDASGSASTEEDQEEAELKEKEKNLTYVHADHMPQEVNDDVVGAVDYGIADTNYMSPDDETYNTDTEGVFAQNGDYYRFQDVDALYFSDALIIGNSRTEGLHGFSSLGKTAYFAAKEGISVFNIFDKTLNYYSPDGSQQSASLTDILASRQFGKIYISLGINEIGIGTSKMFYENYRKILETIREAQPDAIIFIEGMMHVSEHLSSTSGVFSNTIVVQRNTAVSTLANGHDIFYVDMNSVYCDENGNLLSDVTEDGIHPYASEYERWVDFLKTKGIIRTDADRGAVSG